MSKLLKLTFTSIALRLSAETTSRTRQPATFSWSLQRKKYDNRYSRNVKLVGFTILGHTLKSPSLNFTLTTLAKFLGRFGRASFSSVWSQVGPRRAVLRAANAASPHTTPHLVSLIPPGPPEQHIFVCQAVLRVTSLANHLLNANNEPRFIRFAQSTLRMFRILPGLLPVAAAAWCPRSPYKRVLLNVSRGSTLSFGRVLS